MGINKLLTSIEFKFQQTTRSSFETIPEYRSLLQSHYWSHNCWLLNLSNASGRVNSIQSWGNISINRIRNGHNWCIQFIGLYSYSVCHKRNPPKFTVDLWSSLYHVCNVMQLISILLSLYSHRLNSIELQSNDTSMP